VFCVPQDKVQVGDLVAIVSSSLNDHPADRHKRVAAELSAMLSHMLIELAANGVKDPQELRRLALEKFTLPPEPSG
jgi:hypothetical protein